MPWPACFSGRSTARPRCRRRWSGSTGLLLDLLGLTPLGLWAVLLLLLQGGTLAARRRLAPQRFLLTWAAFIGFAGAASLLAWALQSLLALALLPAWPSALEILILGLRGSIRPWRPCSCARIAAPRRWSWHEPSLTAAAIAMSRREREGPPSFTRRAVLIGAAQVGVFGAIAAQLYNLQVMQHGKYAMLAQAELHLASGWWRRSAG